MALGAIYINASIFFGFSPSVSMELRILLSSREAANDTNIVFLSGTYVIGMLNPTPMLSRLSGMGNFSGFIRAECQEIFSIKEISTRVCSISKSFDITFAQSKLKQFGKRIQKHSLNLKILKSHLMILFLGFVTMGNSRKLFALLFSFGEQHANEGS